MCVLASMICAYLSNEFLHVGGWGDLKYWINDNILLIMPVPVPVHNLKVFNGIWRHCSIITVNFTSTFLLQTIIFIWCWVLSSVIIFLYFVLVQSIFKNLRISVRVQPKLSRLIIKNETPEPNKHGLKYHIKL